MKFNLYGNLTEPVVSNVIYDKVISPSIFTWADQVIDIDFFDFKIGEDWKPESTQYMSGNEKDTGIKINNIEIINLPKVFPKSNTSFASLFPELAVFRYPVIFIQSSEFPIFFGANSGNAYRIFSDGSSDEYLGNIFHQRTYKFHLHKGITI